MELSNTEEKKKIGVEERVLHTPGKSSGAGCHHHFINGLNRRRIIRKLE